MLNINKKSRILAIGAHPDDIELSCGGSLIKMKKLFGASIYTLTLTKGEIKSDSLQRIKEQINANLFLETTESNMCDFKDGFLNPNHNLVSEIETHVNKYSPHIIFTHWLSDVHQDHRNTAWATLSATRRSNAYLMFYPSLFTRDQFTPNFFINISDYIDNKIELLSIFKSQSSTDYMTQKVIKARAAESGLYCKCEYAEQFILNFGSI